MNFLLKRLLILFIMGLALGTLLSNQLENFKGECEVGKIIKKTDIEQWKDKVLKIRKKKDKEFKNDPYSPMAGKARLVALRDGKYYLNMFNKSLIYMKKKGEKVLFSVMFKNKKWIFGDNMEGLKCFKGNRNIKSGEELPYRTLAKYGKYSFVIYPLDKYLVTTVFDPDREIVRHFNGLKYYEPNYKYNVKAKIIRLKNPKAVIMLTSRNLEKTFYRYAKLDFKIKGKALMIYAYSMTKDNSDKDDNLLFIPFTDKTTGVETYYAGRYLEISEPETDSFKLDFNLAFNPLCNYSPAYNCAIPPADNNMSVEIKAGEKTYPTKGH